MCREPFSHESERSPRQCARENLAGRDYDRRFIVLHLGSSDREQVCLRTTEVCGRSLGTHAGPRLTTVRLLLGRADTAEIGGPTGSRERPGPVCSWQLGPMSCWAPGAGAGSGCVRSRSSSSRASGEPRRALHCCVHGKHYNMALGLRAPGDRREVSHERSCPNKAATADSTARPNAVDARSLGRGVEAHRRQPARRWRAGSSAPAAWSPQRLRSW